MTFVYSFDHAHPRPPMELKDLLGGKGANLAEMTSVLELPVPPGFTISTDACRSYLAADAWPDGLIGEVDAAVAILEERMGKRLGDRNDPLLVSVRSGSKFSMPGMMDTVLDLGLNDESVRGLANHTDERFAFDSYRRFIQMYAKIVMDADGEEFDQRWDGAVRFAGARHDAEVASDILRVVIDQFKALVWSQTGDQFPQDPGAQLRRAIQAVFDSWNSPRAIAYRNRERIPHDLGTAVNVQVMVFGNRDDNSGTGVGFTRDPATGETGAYGDFLVNAQGEDVVAGIRNTEPMSALHDRWPSIYDELMEIFLRLEHHYRDMLDTEFTIEQGHLWMLQTRVGKRTGAAALRMAVDMTREESIALTQNEAVQRINDQHIDQVLHPRFAGEDHEVLAKGLGASPGAAVGAVFFTADDVVEAVERGQRAVLVRTETSPDDVHGMAAAEGILTSKGGLVSHAAVVARGWGKPAVVGAESLQIGVHSFTCEGHQVREGDVISIDGTSGEVVFGAVDLVMGDAPPEFDVIMGWADEIREGELAVRANADTGPDAARAREYGAEGIGLCRTEHMFLGDRLPVVQHMILADTPRKEADALLELGRVQRADFESILDAMDGLPVTVRLLDPPLHEFLPDLQDLVRREARGELEDKDLRLYAAARQWHEANPMLGTRGVRLAVIKDGLYRMQVRALMEAAANRIKAGGNPIVEVMIPLVSLRSELDLARCWVEEEVAAVQEEQGTDLDVKIGTMIETPRAALCAATIAEAADFFSFGTNDLTQMAFGFSRDDIESRLLPAYLEQGLLARSPFESIDIDGVGEMVRIAADRGRAEDPDLKLGVCGEHGGDPDSIRLFYDAGLDYVSCSPFRVPVARLAAAQAVLDAKKP